MLQVFNQDQEEESWPSMSSAQNDGEVKSSVFEEA